MSIRLTSDVLRIAALSVLLTGGSARSAVAQPVEPATPEQPATTAPSPSAEDEASGAVQAPSGSSPAAETSEAASGESSAPSSDEQEIDALIDAQATEEAPQAEGSAETMPWAYLDGGDPSAASAGEADPAMLQELTGDDDFRPSYPHLDIYGFVDFGVWVPTIKDDNAWSFFFSDDSSFQVGNINLYVASQISESLRSLMEVRFTYLPHGRNRSGVELVEGRASNIYRRNYATDYAEAERPIKLGAIEIERVFLEYEPKPWIGFKVGQWLTPYGIWNVDHGSPTTISARRPYIVGEELLPERQTGIQAFGSFSLGQGHRAGYHLTFSNGRGPLDAYYDMDKNKAFGGRLYASLHAKSFGDLTIGASGYQGRYTDTDREVTVDRSMELVSVKTVNVQYDEWSVAADLRWDFKGILLAQEFAYNQRDYTEEGRPAIAGFYPLLEPTARDTFQPDDRRFGLYSLLGYRFNFLGIMPFFLLDWYRLADQSTPKVMTFTGGINSRPHPSVTIKLQYGYAIFPDAHPNGPGRDDIGSGLGQIAWAF